MPGNHDEFLRPRRAAAAVCRDRESAIHVAADGKRYLVVHGDCFDTVIRNAPWLAVCGDQGYNALIVINTFLNRIGHFLGFRYWSLSRWAKQQVKSAVNYVGSYERVLVKAAAEFKVDGVVCGHIHCPAIHDSFGLVYVNCGDWVESCTAVCEHDDGLLEIIDWANVGVMRPRARAEAELAVT